MKNVLLPGSTQPISFLFDRIGADGLPLIDERGMAFFDYNVATAVSATLLEDDIMFGARTWYAKRLAVYQKRAVRIQGRNGEELPTWREELIEVLEAYRKRVTVASTGAAQALE
jgi:hypothetical protein